VAAAAPSRSSRWTPASVRVSSTRSPRRRPSR
jgi:hypothetical protein